MTTVAQQKQEEEFQQKYLNSDNTNHKHHRPPKHVPFNADTTNHEMYKAYSVSVERPRKCGYQLNKSHYDPDVIKSTYYVDYKKKQSEPVAYQSKYAYQPNSAKFYDETQYKKSYVPSKLEVQKPQFNAQYRPNSARFDGSTTYKSEFKGKATEQAGLEKHYAYQANNLPFNAHTTYGDFYKNFKVDLEKPRGYCNAQYTGSAARFDGHTSYHDVKR